MVALAAQVVLLVMPAVPPPCVSILDHGHMEDPATSVCVFCIYLTHARTHTRTHRGNNGRQETLFSDIPRQWRGAGKVLWRDPDLHMVLAALSELDPASTPGPDGFSGGFYRAFKQHFAPIMLELIRTAAADSTLPVEWIRGMTRCIPKEAGIPASDSLDLSPC